MCVSALELEEFPEVSYTTKIVNGTRSVTLTWKVMLRWKCLLGNVCVYWSPNVYQSILISFLTKNVFDFQIRCMENGKGSHWWYTDLSWNSVFKEKHRMGISCCFHSQTVHWSRKLQLLWVDFRHQTALLHTRHGGKPSTVIKCASLTTMAVVSFLKLDLI